MSAKPSFLGSDVRRAPIGCPWTTSDLHLNLTIISRIIRSCMKDRGIGICTVGSYGKAENGSKQPKLETL